MDNPEHLTPTRLIAAATEFLTTNGYRRARSGLGDLSETTARVFEDEYGVVATAVYESLGDLLVKWTDAQAHLVELITAHIRRTEAKASEGYLVLLTPSIPQMEERKEVEEIRYDTLRVRKLVGTGDELQELSGVERILLPVLPLRTPLRPRTAPVSVLDLLPEILSRRGIPESATRIVVETIRQQESILETLEKHLRDNANNLT
jgi:hypothetical protein